jgi:hypothetical protein
VKVLESLFCISGVIFGGGWTFVIASVSSHHRDNVFVFSLSFFFFSLVVSVLVGVEA